MKTIKDKQLVVGADFAGYPLKETVTAHLKAKGWNITDMGVKADSDPNDTDLMFHRWGLRVGSMISEGEFERAAVVLQVRAWESILPPANVPMSMPVWWKVFRLLSALLQGRRKCIGYGGFLRGSSGGL